MSNEKNNDLKKVNKSTFKTFIIVRRKKHKD